jgi:hypothetical protein
MSTQAAVSGNAYKNNGATIKKAGAASTTSGPITSSRSLLDDAITTQYGSKVVLSSGSTGSSGNIGTASAFTNFAYDMVAGRYIMKKNTSYVNGSASTLLTSCAADVGIRRPIPVLETTRVYGSGVNTSWDYVTGAITKGASAGNATTFINPVGGGASADSAAHPTDAVPGELAYKTGAKLPVADEYKPRTG